MLTLLTLPLYRTQDRILHSLKAQLRSLCRNAFWELQAFLNRTRSRTCLCLQHRMSKSMSLQLYRLLQIVF